ncbi:DUF4198 domain-containing protein [Shewanella amazonensis]|uniref:Uncharacterized protein n=1 Tax=Shewanella amazonensis (strain ATCC BAA-1098 / SB2B) TaxID=326297 RepID=A1S9F6_SHEAM|nr:DUF4198 domain-containing protein [Shewanella amazonensis]ABM01013.1 conserved hypothetical protein [Shewanella amazonensis SB2B]
MKRLIPLTALLFLPLTQAHDRWILPTHFNVSAEDGKGVWISADVSASNQVFEVDKPFGAEDVLIVTPEGNTDRPSSSYRGSRRSVFDYQLTGEGTYRLEKEAKPRYFSRYKIKGQDTPVRSNLDKAATRAAMPKDAVELESALYFSRVESYVTLNKPSDKAFAPKGEYLELVPVTHPADFVEGEPLSLKLLFNGKPAEGVKVNVVADGTRYRNQIEEVSLVSDKAGLVQFTPARAGRFLLHAEYEEAMKDTRLADKTVSEIFLTFEASLQ